MHLFTTLKIAIVLSIFTITLPINAYSEDTTNNDKQKEASTKEISKEASEKMGELIKKLDTLKTQGDSLEKKAKGLKNAKSVIPDITQLKDNISNINSIAVEIDKKTTLLNEILGKETKRFHLSTGIVSMSPYKIEGSPDNLPYKLASTGEVDKTYFIELLAKYRRAWIGNLKGCDEWKNTIKSCWGGGIRIGLTGADKDPTASVAAGTGNSYIEFDAGLEKKLISRPDPGDPVITLGPSLRGGIVTDKANQTIHAYYGIGALLNFSFPAGERSLEALLGLYFGEIDMPVFVSEDSTEIETRRGVFPKFKPEEAFMIKTEAHFPVGLESFVTLYGNFNVFLENSRSLPNPWTLGLGYTFSIDNLFNAIAATAGF